jgi:hypothetical protein
MSHENPIERLGRELHGAAVRQAAAEPAAPQRRRWRGRGPAPWRGRTFAVTILAVLTGAGAASWAATSLLSSGSPVPFQRGAPIAGQAQGAPVPGTVKLLAGDIADPDGGPPWGLRYWETDRKYACVQVGRVDGGKLGQVSGKVFHELRLGVTRGILGGCYALDGSGHAFTAIHTDAQPGAQAPSCPIGFPVGTVLKSPHGRTVRCAAQERTVDFGLLGPDAQRFTYRAGGQDHTSSPLGGVGAYLVVQRRVKPVIREYGFHHRDPKLNLKGPAEPYLALTPASQVLKRITYKSGTCVVRITASPYGSCNATAGFVPIPQPHVADVETKIRAFATPDGRAIRVRFRARQAVVDGRSGYDIELRPVGRRQVLVQSYEHNVEAGARIHTTVAPSPRRRGRYLIVVRYRTVRSRPGPYASLAYPGLLVGRAQVDLR